MPRGIYKRTKKYLDIYKKAREVQLERKKGWYYIWKEQDKYHWNLKIRNHNLQK